LLLLQKGCQAIEPVVPKAFVAGEPLHGAFHGSGLQATPHGAAALGALDQVGPGQHVEVLHDRGQRHRERLGQLCHRLAVLPRQLLEDGPPRRVCQRGKRTIELFVLNVNHVVKYCVVRRRCQGVRLKKFLAEFFARSLRRQSSVPIPKFAGARR
jgi:hypothetical protein